MTDRHSELVITISGRGEVTEKISNCEVTEHGTVIKIK